jgi:phosphatidylinositol 4-kinase A
MLMILSISLELNIRQLVLTDIATNIAERSHDASKQGVSSVIELVTSQVDTRDVVAEVSANEEECVFMVSV